MKPIALCLLLAAALSGCDRSGPPVLTPLPPLTSDAGRAAPRINGATGAAAPLTVQTSLAPATTITLPSARASGGAGDVSLDFADTDIRDVVAQMLGTLLRQNYTIDPAVHGAATFKTSVPVSREDLLPILQTLLAQNGAALVQQGGLYRILPAAAAASASGFTSTEEGGGTVVLPLHFASAEDLAKTLAPYVQGGGRILADTGRNALLISGDPTTRSALASLAASFDVDVLAGQSYALLPVTNGDAKDFASALQDAVRGSGGALSGVVRVVPMTRVNAVLVVSSQPRYVDDVRRIYRLVERSRAATGRTWHVYYLQNSRSNDTAYVLQQAFTPNDVTAHPGASGEGSAAQQIASRGFTGGSISAGGNAGGSLGGNAGSGVAAPTAGGIGTGGAGTTSGTAGVGAPAASAGGSANPLLGGLDPAEGNGQGAGKPDGMRIIPNVQTNALLIYATPVENNTVENMLRKLDILPLQVRIDATIAEVDLNDTLQYGTQYFFRAGIQGALSFGATAAGFASGFPGFVLSGPNNTSAALSALQSVTKVRVLSSPQLLVVDNQPARLQVGALVPYLSGTAQSTLTTGSPIVTSINYQQTGVIMQVTPRVNTGGLVTLDITQEVSSVASGVTTAGVNSPTFNERSVTSRVVVQDGQTIGLAGLINDNDSRQNQGIPFLKDIPLLGTLLSDQNNQRTRTELLVLITPHVVHDQRDARSLTEDLREGLLSSAAVPQQLQALPSSGAADPNAPLRRRLGLPQ